MLYKYVNICQQTSTNRSYKHVDICQQTSTNLSYPTDKQFHSDSVNVARAMILFLLSWLLLHCGRFLNRSVMVIVSCARNHPETVNCWPPATARGLSTGSGMFEDSLDELKTGKARWVLTDLIGRIHSLLQPILTKSHK